MATIISQNLLNVAQHLSTHHDLFASTQVFPLPEFPGRTEENFLGQLLRKKLEPNVEDWVEQGRKTALEASGGDETAQGHPEDKSLLDLWDWAGRAANEEARKRQWGDDFTLEEREMGVENVVTGLHRKLGVGDDEESEDDEEVADREEEMEGPDKMEMVEMPLPTGDTKSGSQTSVGTQQTLSQTSQPPMRMDDVLRFMSTGVELNGGHVG